MSLGRFASVLTLTCEVWSRLVSKWCFRLLPFAPRLPKIELYILPPAPSRGLDLGLQLRSYNEPPESRGLCVRSVFFLEIIFLSFVDLATGERAYGVWHLRGVQQVMRRQCKMLFRFRCVPMVFGISVASKQRE